MILTLDSCVTITSFDLWMSRFGHYTFAFVINFINSQWVPCHVAMGLFEIVDTTWVIMAMQVKNFLSFYNLLEKLIPYVKDEGGNLLTLARILPSIVNYTFMAFLVFLPRFMFWPCFQQNIDVNMLTMILMFVSVFVRVVWRPHNLCYKKQSHGLRSLTKDVTKAKGMCWCLALPSKAKNIYEYHVCFNKVVCSQITWNIEML